MADKRDNEKVKTSNLNRKPQTFSNRDEGDEKDGENLKHQTGNLKQLLPH